MYILKSICPISRNAFALTAGGTFRRLAHLARMVNLTAIGPVATCTKSVGKSPTRPGTLAGGGDPPRDFNSDSNQKWFTSSLESSAQEHRTRNTQPSSAIHRRTASVVSISETRGTNNSATRRRCDCTRGPTTEMQSDAGLTSCVTLVLRLKTRPSKGRKPVGLHPVSFRICTCGRSHTGQTSEGAIFLGADTKCLRAFTNPTDAPQSRTLRVSDVDCGQHVGENAGSMRSSKTTCE